MTNSIDLEVARWCAEHRNGSVTDIFRFLQDLGESPLFFLSAVVVAVALGVLLRIRSDSCAWSCPSQ